MSSPSSSIASSSRMTLQPGSSANIESKSSAEIFDLEAPEISDARARSWYERSYRSFLANHPRFTRAIYYLRGPRPKVELPDPTPWLNLTLYTGRRSRTLALEPALIRATRPFTSPWLFWILAAGYIVAFAFLARAQSFLTPADSFISCTAAYWAADNGCGLDGQDCMPFSGTNFTFRCPAQCSSVTLENPRTIGDTTIDFVPVLIGGGDANHTYRADSFICAAAIQAGVIDNGRGGCGTLQLIGNYTNYLPFTAHGLTSIGFPTIFPMSFQFIESGSLDYCTDLRNYALVLNVLVTAALFMVLRPKPIVLYWSLVCIGFWHVALFSEPMGTPPPLDQAFGAFLPALFVAYAFWRLAFRFTLPAFRKAPIEASVWYLAPYWAGVLTNITTDKIPINTLTAKYLSTEPGAIPALVIILVVLLFIIVNQVRIIRKTGWLPYYFGWYLAGALVAVVLSQLPGLEFRLHHYIIAMVLIPGTAWPTRPSAVYQGFLLGMFLNGVAAWGFDSILQTAADLQGDGPSGSAMPSFATNSSNWDASIALVDQIISWYPLPDASEGWTGFSLLVDDVERYTGAALNYSLAALQAGLPHFFRLAYISGGTTGDYTMPATIWPNGTWVDPLPGTSS